MRTTPKPYPLTTIYGYIDRIDPSPDYQRPAAWTLKQKQLLIDTILRGYDIPKVYWRRVSNRKDKIQYEVVDGQQRLTAIWDFCENKFALAKDMDPVTGMDCAGQTYEDLDLEIRKEFDIYTLDVVVIEDAENEDDEVRDMFLRLQNGSTLRAQEKRNAMGGDIRDLVTEFSTHKFFESCKFRDIRLTHAHILAQMVCIELAKGPTNIGYAALNKMYTDNKKLKNKEQLKRKVKKTLNFLAKAFPEKTPELEKHCAITLYALVSLMLEKFPMDGLEGKLHDWFIDFEIERQENLKLDEDNWRLEFVEYRRLTSHTTDSSESIRARLEIAEARFMLANPDLLPLDSKREFTYEQRLAIYRKNNGECQIKKHCTGGKIGWDFWHADHIVPYSKGGQTTVANGQVSCGKCNQSKGNELH